MAHYLENTKGGRKHLEKIKHAVSQEIDRETERDNKKYKEKINDLIEKLGIKQCRIIKYDDETVNELEFEKNHIGSVFDINKIDMDLFNEKGFEYIILSEHHFVFDAEKILKDIFDNKNHFEKILAILEEVELEKDVFETCRGKVTYDLFKQIGKR